MEVFRLQENLEDFSPATFSKKTQLSDKTRFVRTALSGLETTKDRDFSAPATL